MPTYEDMRTLKEWVPIRKEDAKAVVSVMQYVWAVVYGNNLPHEVSSLWSDSEGALSYATQLNKDGGDGMWSVQKMHVNRAIKKKVA